jgi:MFS family permease
VPNPYVDLFRHPGAAAFSLTGVVARLPISMVGIGIVLVVKSASGSYALAGAVAATAGIAFALISPQLSRLVDRFGQRRVTTPQLVVFASGLVAIVLLAEHDAPSWTLFVAAVVAGAEPTIGSLVRSRWSATVEGGPSLRTAYSWESVLDEVIFVVGPPAVTICAVHLGAPVALYGVAAIGLVGGLLFLAQRRSEPPLVEHGAAGRGSALSEPWLRVLILIMFFLGGIFGCVEVVTIARADELGRLPAAGVLLALYAFGSLVAGLAYGWKRPSLPLRRQMVVGSVAMALLTPLFFLAAGSLTVLGVTAVVCGLAISPTLIVGFALVEELAPAERLTESLTWLSTGIALGVALSAAVSGALIDASGARPAYLVAVGCGLLTAVSGVAGRRRLVPARTREDA